MTFALAFLLALAPAPQTQPLFAFVQTSDSQPTDAGDQAQFEEVLEVIAESGQSGALLRRRVSFVLFAGDLVDSSTTSEWNDFVDTVDAYLTASGIALLAVPGNHDQGSGVELYEQFIGDSSPWGAGSAALTGQNGIAVAPGWGGLRFIGLNNSNGGANQVSSADRLDVEARVDAAVAQQENVFLIAHHPHDASGRLPLLNALETPGVVGYMRGHTGSPLAESGLSGIDNPDLFEFNTNSIHADGAMIYFEAFESELHAYVLQLRTDPSGLPTPVVIPLVHDLEDGEPEPPDSARLLPVADAHVNSARANQNFGAESELRLRLEGSNSWRSFVRFDLSSLGDVQPQSARLRLYCTDSSSDGGSLYATSASWSEGGITAANAPAPSGALLAGPRSIALNTWVEYDVSGAVAAGVRNFVLVSASNNGAKYSSREGAQPPELVLDLGAPTPVSITSVVPSSVEVFVPGTQETITVNGSGFGAGTTLELDGTALSADSFTLVSATRLTVDLPPTSVGAHSLGVRRGTSTDSAPLQVVAAAAPRLQLGHGDAGLVIAGGEPFTILAAGPIGSQQFVLMSTSLSPSTSSIVDLLIGANFSDLHVVASLPIPPAGFASQQLVLDPAASFLVHAQALSFGFGAPIPSSNLQTFQLVP